MKDHSKGILMEGNRFERNSGLRGPIVIEIAAGYEKGVVLFNNTFSQSSGLIRAGVLNLRSRYQENEPHSCSGFHIQHNSFERTVLLKPDASVIYLACVFDDFPQLDGNQDISGTEYLSSPESRPFPLLLTH